VYKKMPGAACDAEALAADGATHVLQLYAEPDHEPAVLSHVRLTVPSVL
jgi:hypothetical protein